MIKRGWIWARTQRYRLRGCSKRAAKVLAERDFRIATGGDDEDRDNFTSTVEGAEAYERLHHG